MASVTGKPKSTRKGSSGTHHPKQRSTGEHKKSSERDHKQGETPTLSSLQYQQNKRKQEGQKAATGQPASKTGSTENQNTKSQHHKQGGYQKTAPCDQKQGGIPDLTKRNLDVVMKPKADRYRQQGVFAKHPHKQKESSERQKYQVPKGSTVFQQSRAHYRKPEVTMQHQNPSIIQHQDGADTEHQRPKMYHKPISIPLLQNNPCLAQTVPSPWSGGNRRETLFVRNTRYWLNCQAAINTACTAEDKTEGVLANVSTQVPAVDIGRVNQTAQDCIINLAETDQHVSKYVVSALLCKCLQVPSVTAMGLKSEYDIPAVAEFMKTHKAVHMFIKAYKSVRSVSTLHELGQDAACLQRKREFRELGLGPLCRHPEVARQYGLPSSMKDSDIPKITTTDVLQNLRMYLTSNQGQRVDLAEFMRHLKNKYRVNSVQELGVSITSIGLAISMIYKAQRCDTEAVEQARAQIEQDVLKDMEIKLQQQRQSILNLFDDSDGGTKLKQEYARRSAADLLFVVFQNADQIFSNKIKKTVQNFLSQVAGDPLAKTLFQIAVCGGSLVTPTEPGPSEISCDSFKLKTEDIQPTLAESTVRDELLELLGGAGVTASLSLGDLAEIEKQLTEHFNAPDFPSLGHGSFLEFLNRNSKVLEKAGVSTLTLDTLGKGNVGFCSTGNQLIDFDAFCISTEPLDKESQQQDNPFKDPFFSGATPSDGSLDPQKSQAGVGLQGNVGAERALQCLLTAPLLEDFAAWSHWELLFEHKQGTLKDFIKNVCSGQVVKLGEKIADLTKVSELIALEVQPGLLLRIVANPSPEKFADAALRRDSVVTAAQLVSLVAVQGLSEAPLALMTNRMEVVLTIMAEEKADLYTASGMQGAITAAQFVLDCLCQIPLQLCKDLAPQVFLIPFENTVGEADWQNLLLRAASMSDWQSGTRRARLHELGQLLDIKEWTLDFQGGPEDLDITENSEEESGSMESESDAEEESDSEFCKLDENT